MIMFLTILLLLLSAFLVLIVLVQRGRGGGLSGAFGSGGGSSSAFGTKTGDVFTTVTVVLFVVFMLLAIWLNFRFQSYTDKLEGTVIKESPTSGPATAASLIVTPSSPTFPKPPPPATTTAPATAP